ENLFGHGGVSSKYFVKSISPLRECESTLRRCPIRSQMNGGKLWWDDADLSESRLSGGHPRFRKWKFRVAATGRRVGPFQCWFGDGRWRSASDRYFVRYAAHARNA